MNTASIDVVRNAVHLASLVAIGILAMVILVGIIRPQLLRVALKDFADRKYIAGVGAFLLLFCATTVVATEDPQVIRQSGQNLTTPATVNQISDDGNALAVSTKDTETFEAIPFEKQKVDDNTMPSGQTKIVQAGKNGQKKQTWTISEQDGKELSKILKSEEILTQPVTEITHVGTAKNPGASTAPSSASPQPNSQITKPSTQAPSTEDKTQGDKDCGGLIGRIRCLL